MTFNRTTVECKWYSETATFSSIGAFNRTTVECKYRGQGNSAGFLQNF